MGGGGEVEPHRVYRTLDDPVALLSGLEMDDLIVIAGGFVFWNMALGLLDRIKLVSILSPLLLGALTVLTAWAWLRAKEGMPRYFLRDYIRYLWLPDAYDVGPDLEAFPYVALLGDEGGDDEP